MSGFIPLSVPNLKGNELKYVTEAIETEWVSTGGPYVSEFERITADYVKAKGAVSCQNGTSGIHTALMVCGVSRGDEVIVPALTFIAAVNPVKYIGAEPIFMDCDDDLVMDVDKLEAFCENECKVVDDKLINKETDKVVKAVVVVHVFGNMADMERIMHIADRYHLIVIEDATEAIGTYYTEGIYKGKYAGTIGEIGIFSYNGNKIITTGGGGMIVSNNEELLSKAKHLTTQAKSDELYYMHDEIGYNYRMTNLQAALGIAQMEQLEDFIYAKIHNYNLYKRELENVKGLTLLDFKDGIRSNHWFYSLIVEEPYPLDKDELIKVLADNGIQSRPIWGLIPEQLPYHGSQVYQIEKAASYISKVVNIPCSTNLKEADVIKVVTVLKGLK